MLSDDIHRRIQSPGKAGNNGKKIPETIVNFRNLSDGHYIIKTNDSDGEKKFELRHCEIRKWKNELAKDGLSDWEELYKYVENIHIQVHKRLAELPNSFATPVGLTE